ncbi:type II toxin-antitoxin system RelE/ParE family toxin [Catenovulum sp. SX2]|uniref:type II toxin-antitoxin system RelE/ParE family toxin n=1 Tax=Catenovulum sp. SX2 TaxID=3398614 RepID=UPI003F868860
MRIYKSKWFSKWADKEGLQNSDLTIAVQEMQDGLIDADLGGHVVKKRVGLNGQGKSGGVRTLLAFKIDEKAFFMFGFAKNQQDNIDKKALKTLRLMAKELLSYSEKMILTAVNKGELIEVKQNE